MIFNNVLLPTPLAPITLMHSFGSAAKLMEFNNNRPEGSTYEMSLARMPESAVMLIPPAMVCIRGQAPSQWRMMPHA
ncbi:hypothetical protein [Bifidobacterium animalis]|nr:hypothetical protein [Bifidobacterium animalis]